MAISLKHLFQSAKTDGPDNTIVQPSDWNDEHVLTQATNRLLGRTTAGTGATEEIAPGTGITLSAGTLSADVTSVAGRTGAVTLSTADISGLTTGYVQKTSATGSAYLPAGTTGQREGSPSAGYIRYNTTTGKFEGYGSSWGNIGGGAAIGDTPPANPGAGDLWWESSSGILYVYYSDTNSSQWVAVVAGGAPVDQTPAGTIIHTARSTAPTGYLKADGSTISRSTYATLFAAIGTTFGVGDGSTTFKLPDLRGEFVRGFDDGRGVDTSRVFGSSQADELKGHTHSYVQSTFTYPSLGNPDSAGYTTVANPSGNTSVNSGSTGGTETRPRNIALLACIKF